MSLMNTCLTRTTKKIFKTLCNGACNQLYISCILGTSRRRVSPTHYRHIREFVMRTKIFLTAVLFVVLAAMSSASPGQTFGVHLNSRHTSGEDWQNNRNFGLYVVTKDNWTAGFYKNTFDRWTVYGGYRFTFLPLVDVDVGVASGYQKRYETLHGVTGTFGVSNAKLIPLVVPSIAPVEIFGVRPRLSYIPKVGKEKHAVMHLSVEYEW